MVVRKSISNYPDNWPEIAQQIKDAAGWKCVRCGHPHDPENGYVLTCHHLDMDCQNNAWWNTPALCQRCHLHIQAKVILEQQLLPTIKHSEWFISHVEGYLKSLKEK